MILLSLFFFSLSVFSDECFVNLEARNLINMAVEKQIDVTLAQKETPIIEGYIRNAQKITNPELEHFSTTGNQQGDNNVTSESRLWFHIQTNGKRRKRADVFRADQERNEVNIQVLQTQVRRNLFLNILRNKQLLDEQARIEGIKDVLDDLLQKYKKITYLSAEQILEKGSLEVANEELEISLLLLKNEISGINKFYQTVTRSECRVALITNPKVRKNSWPDLSDYTFQPERSLFTKLGEIALEKSKLEFTREQANAYPDLRIGPMWQLNRLGNTEYNLFGVGFILPIPSTDLNQGMKQATKAGIARNEKQLDFQQEEMRREFRLNHVRYMSSYKQVMDFRKTEGFQGQILENRKLFGRGLISIPLFLTYKREVVGLITKVHELELDLAQYLADLLIINNAPLDDNSLKVLNL